MQRNSNANANGQSVGWTIAYIPFHTAPGIRWRLHMSKIATVYPNAREREIKDVEVIV
jgi:hypothetical protein